MNAAMKNNNRKLTVSYNHVKTKLHISFGEKGLCRIIYASEYKLVISTK